MSQEKAEKISRAVETKTKHLFKTALRCIEIKFGDNFEGYDRMRSEILRVGNNTIRELKELIGDEFGLEDQEATQVRITGVKHGQGN